MSARSFAWFAVLVLGTGEVFAQGPWVPVGSEFQINAYTTGEQVAPELATQPGGDFVVVWRGAGSTGTDQDGSSIQARRFSSSGEPLGSDFQVNSYTTGNVGPAEVATDGEGDFVIVWSRSTPGPSSHSVRGRRFSVDGTPDGEEFLVNTYTGSSGDPSIAMNAAGDFVVTWTSYYIQLIRDIRAQRFLSTGAPNGDEFLVNPPEGDHIHSAVAMNDDGAFTVAWVDLGYLVGRVFGPDGSPATEGLVMDDSGGAQAPHAAADSEGNFIVAWARPLTQIRVQRLDSNGSFLGSQSQIFTDPDEVDQGGSVTADPKTGDFVVVWSASPVTGGPYRLVGSRFSRVGEPMGPDFVIDGPTSTGPGSLDVAFDAEGRLVTVWSRDQGGSLFDIIGRRFGSLSFFADGFESGDVSAWSSVEPGE